MKTLITVMLLTLSTLSMAQETHTIYIDDTLPQSLRLEGREIKAALGYPGRNLSGNCGVEIRTKSDEISRLLDVVEITSAPVTILNRWVLRIDLTEQSGRYLGVFGLKTKDGRTLKANLDDLFGKNEPVIFLASPCR